MVCALLILDLQCIAMQITFKRYCMRERERERERERGRERERERISHYPTDLYDKYK